MSKNDCSKAGTSLSDTEFAENVIELVFMGDFAGNLAEELQTATNVEC